MGLVNAYFNETLNDEFERENVETVVVNDQNLAALRAVLIKSLHIQHLLADLWLYLVMQGLPVVGSQKILKSELERIAHLILLLFLLNESVVEADVLRVVA